MLLSFQHSPEAFHEVNILFCLDFAKLLFNPLIASTTCHQLPAAILDFNQKIEML